MALVPFHYDPLMAPYVVVRVSLNGGPALPFVVDTGSNVPIVVNTWAAKKLKLILGASQNAAPNFRAGSTTVTPTAVDTVRLVGTDKHNDVTTRASGRVAIVMDLSYFGFDDYSGPRLAGIVGADLLRFHGLVVDFDFVNSLLRVHSRSPYPLPGPNTAVVPLRSDPDGYHFRASFGGHSVEFLLDTGAPNTYIRDAAAMPSSVSGTAKIAFFGLDQTGFESVTLLPVLEIGGLTECDVPARSDYGLNPTLVGLDFLSRFAITLDLEEGCLILRRLSPSSRHPTRYGRSGVSLRQQGNAYSVSGVEADSSSEKAGVQSGDRIIQVDGRRLDGLPMQVAQSLLDGFAGTTARLEARRDGRAVVLGFVRQSWLEGKNDALPGVEFSLKAQRLMVDAVAPSSPTDQKLHEGDEVLLLNGQPVTEMSAGQILAVLNSSAYALCVRRIDTIREAELHAAVVGSDVQVIVGPPHAGYRWQAYAGAGWAEIPT